MSRTDRPCADCGRVHGENAWQCEAAGSALLVGVRA